VCYSPLGRGLLSKTFTCSADLDASDWRLTQPRFEGETCARNSENISKFHQIAERKGCTSAQLALSWYL
jgi:aryl-alcohol dehydrogenase-like predicted oxidoreductase